jgi:hypothetical protein
MLNRKIKKILTIFFTIVILFGVVSFDAYANADIPAEEIDKTKPVMDYAYIEDGRLMLRISDDRRLDSKPIEYKIDKEIRSYEIDINDYEHEYDGKKKKWEIYEIKVEIPSSVSIIVKDRVGNESTYSFSIKEDNVSLSK